MLEIEVSIILYNPGDIGNLIFLVSTILEIRAAGGRLQGLGSGGLGLFLEYGPGISGYPGNIGNMISTFCVFQKSACFDLNSKVTMLVFPGTCSKNNPSPRSLTPGAARPPPVFPGF